MRVLSDAKEVKHVEVSIAGEFIYSYRISALSSFTQFK